jgi:lysophospholipase L1-like esterase
MSRSRPSRRTNRCLVRGWHPEAAARVALVAFAGVLGLAGCGGSSAASGRSAASAEAVATTSRPASIVALGDSQTAGAWLDQPDVDSWPAQLNQLVCPGEACVANLGLGGQPLATDIPSGVRPLLETLDEQLAGHSDATTAVVLIGQVDLVSSDDVDAIGAGYVQLADRLHASGIASVVFVTLFPFDPASYPNPEWLSQLDPRRLALNDRLRTMTEGDVRVVDVEQSLTIDGTTSLRPEYGIHDGNHPSVEGAAVIAAAVTAAID